MGIVFKGGTAFSDDVVDRVFDGPIEDAGLATLDGSGRQPESQVPTRLADSALAARFARKLPHALAAAALRPLHIAYPGLYSPAPTVVFAANTGGTAIAGSPQTHRVRAPQSMRHIGMVPTYNSTFASMDASAARGTKGVEIEVRADVVEFFFKAGAGSGEYWVWVDDKPVTADPVAWAGTAGSTQRLTVTFPGVESRRITIYMNLLDIQQVLVAGSQSVQASPRRPVKMMGVGDSLTEAGTTDGVLVQLSWLNHVRSLLGWDVIGNAVGGAGYVTGGGAGTPFTHLSRITAMSDPSIDFYHFKGSVNDNGVAAATLQAAAELCYQTIYNVNPDAKILVSGPDPTGGVDSLSASVRANSDAVRAAALNFASKNVIGWIDPLMTRGATPWVGSTPYVVGNRVTHQGGVYVCVADNSSGGFSPINFGLISPLYGTGRTSSFQNNGNRDRFIISDDVHWSIEAHRFFGRYYADHYVQAFAAFGRGEFYMHE